MDLVYKLFENYFANIQHNSKWFYGFGDEDEKRAMKLIDRGYIYSLAERDDDGKTVIMYQMQRLDPDEFTFNDAVR